MAALVGPLLAAACPGGEDRRSAPVDAASLVATQRGRVPSADPSAGRDLDAGEGERPSLDDDVAVVGDAARNGERSDHASDARADARPVSPASCATAVPACVVRGSDAAASNELYVRPLDRLDCTGAGSAGHEGTIVGYIWEVAEAPTDSASRPTPTNTRDTSFFVDLAGRYVLTLTAVTDSGCASLPAPVVAVTKMCEDVHVQLVWHTLSDPDATDAGLGAGADVDLHLLHPNGCWNDLAWDCHFQGRSPRWGDLDSGDDDPSLDLDDTDGAGPENINLNDPEDGTTYLIAAHYKNDHGFGPSAATVRVYLYGELVFEESRLMPHMDFWWVAAAVSWPAALVTPIDEVYEGTPSCAR